MPVYEGIGLISEKHPVVLEIGRSLTKAGFAGDPSPRCILSSAILGRRLYDFKDDKDLYQMLVGFLHKLYSRYLLVTPKDRKVVVVESLFATTVWRQTLAKVLYLHFEVLTVLWIPSPIAAVVTTNQDTALVIDFGVEEVQVIPVFKGVTILKGVVCQELGSQAFDENLKKILLEGCSNKNIEDLLTLERIEDIRIRCCAITSMKRSKLLQDPNTPKDKFKPFVYELDGENFVHFDGIVREKPGEFWFQNNDLDGISIPLMVLQSLSLCPIDTRRPLGESIIITGGTGMLPGLKGRLLKELSTLVSSANELFDPILRERFASGGYNFKIFDSIVKENYINWLGGAVVGATESLILRGVQKDFFLKNGLVPDWCNLQYDMVNGRISVPGSSSTRESPAHGSSR